MIRFQLIFASIQTKHMYLMSRVGIIVFFIIVLTCEASLGQERIHFDRNGVKAEASAALYYRNSKPDKDSIYRAFYVNGDAKYYEIQILKTDNLDERKNVLNGKCIWYHKNQNKKQVTYYNSSGQKHGVEEIYYESGQLKTQIEYKLGIKSKGTFLEYTENGSKIGVTEEYFEDNYNDWDLFSSAESKSTLNDKKLIVESFGKTGTSRFIGLPKTNDDFLFEIELENVTEKKGKYGVLLGYKDWENYSFITLSDQYFYIGSVVEGLRINLVEGSFCACIKPETKNQIKVFSTDDNSIFSINGEIVFKRSIPFSGNKFGVLAGSKQKVEVSKLIFKDFTYSGGDRIGENDGNVKSTGTGFFVTQNGVIVTNYHVVESGKSITIETKVNGQEKEYRAKVLHTDKQNDIAILKIDDNNFKEIPEIKFSLKANTVVNVGNPVFTLGFPYALNGMGKEVKFADGRISSKTGYNQDISSYQTTLPVQPGNSGGPLFSESGVLIGILNAKYKEADNVSYAVKSSYILNNLDLINELGELPNYQFPTTSKVEDKIQAISPFIVIIKVR